MSVDSGADYSPKVSDIFMHTHGHGLLLSADAYIVAAIQLRLARLFVHFLTIKAFFRSGLASHSSVVAGSTSSKTIPDLRKGGNVFTLLCAC